MLKFDQNRRRKRTKAVFDFKQVKNGFYTEGFLLEKIYFAKKKCVL